MEAQAQSVLDARAVYLIPVGRASSRAETSPATEPSTARGDARPTSETKPYAHADLYDPLSMPPELDLAAVRPPNALNLTRAQGRHRERHH